MKVVMLTWEFPPRIVGGIARHCYNLSKALAKKGVEVHVVTLEFPGAPYYEEIEGVHIHRIRLEMGNPNFITWVLLFNHLMEKKVGMLRKSIGEFDIVHSHDWLTTIAGINLKYNSPSTFILTLHSLEHGRSGLHTADSLTIDSIEWWGTYEAKYIISISGSLKNEIVDHFKVPAGKIFVIPNGIDIKKFDVKVDCERVRAKYGIGYGEKLILAVGRLVWRKGFQYLIEAMPIILSKHPNAKLVIVGTGPMRGDLERKAFEVGCRGRIIFAGFLPDHELIALMKCADVLVIPSLYEPFGLVALEGMAAGVPVVVSKTGGLEQIVEHDKDGIWVYPGNPHSIAWGVDRILSDPEYAKWLVKNAREKVKQYDWDSIAEKTLKVYNLALGR